MIPCDRLIISDSLLPFHNRYIKVKVAQLKTCGSSGKYAQNLNRPEKCEIGHRPNLLHQKHENPLERDRNSPDQTFCAGLIQICSCWMGLPDMFQPTNNSIFTKTEQILGTIILQLVFRSQRRALVCIFKEIYFPCFCICEALCVWQDREQIGRLTDLAEHRYLTKQPKTTRSQSIDTWLSETTPFPANVSFQAFLFLLFTKTQS